MTVSQLERVAPLVPTLDFGAITVIRNELQDENRAKPAETRLFTPSRPKIRQFWALRYRTETFLEVVTETDQ